MDGVRVLLGCDHNDGIGGMSVRRGSSSPCRRRTRIGSLRSSATWARIVPVDTVSPHGCPAAAVAAAPVEAEPARVVPPRSPPVVHCPEAVMVATTATVNARTVLAAPALTAYSAAAVARGDAAVTDYDDHRRRARAGGGDPASARHHRGDGHQHGGRDARGDGPDARAAVRVAAAEIARDGTGDQYAQQAKFFATSFGRER